VSGFGAKPDSAAMLVLLNQQQQHKKLGMYQGPPVAQFDEFSKVP
jgi:hypothetical protein